MKQLKIFKRCSRGVIDSTDTDNTQNDKTQIKHNLKF